ncbi:MAG: hypothetical protein WC890_06165 [Candidatus Margulisiibacteriota bacterium]
MFVMMVGGDRATSRVDLAKSHISKNQLKQRLSQMGIQWRFCSLTPSRLLNLPSDRFEAYMRLLAKIIPNEGVRPVLNLVTPSATVLLATDPSKLMENEEKMTEIIRQCYLPKQAEIDLTPLGWIC